MCLAESLRRAMQGKIEVEFIEVGDGVHAQAVAYCAEYGIESKVQFDGDSLSAYPYAVDALVREVEKQRKVLGVKRAMVVALDAIRVVMSPTFEDLRVGEYFVAELDSKRVYHKIGSSFLRVVGETPETLYRIPDHCRDYRVYRVDLSADFAS